MTWQIDKDIALWINGLVGKNSVLDRLMIVGANDYFVPVTIALILLAIWFIGRDPVQKHDHQMAVICATIAIGSACGFVLAANHLYRHPHPFEDLPQLLDAVHKIYYPIRDPAFPSNTSAITFAAATSIWQKNRKLGLLILVPAILMPFAKCYAGVYYFSDVLAGAVLGILTSYFIYKIAIPVLRPGMNIILAIVRRLCLVYPEPKVDQAASKDT